MIKFFTAAEFNRIDKIGVEVRDRSVKNFERRVFAEKFVADSLHEVSFAKTWSAVEEEGIIALTRSIDNAASSRDGEIVVGTDDKII